MGRLWIPPRVPCKASAGRRNSAAAGSVPLANTHCVDSKDVAACLRLGRPSAAMLYSRNLASVKRGATGVLVSSSAMQLRGIPAPGRCYCFGSAHSEDVSGFLFFLNDVSTRKCSEHFGGHSINGALGHSRLSTWRTVALSCPRAIEIDGRLSRPPPVLVFRTKISVRHCRHHFFFYFCTSELKCWLPRCGGGGYCF